MLRHGVVDHGVTIRLAYFKPAHGLTPELGERYEANRLTVTRQLPYEADSTKTLDLALFVNGIPVATAELKNPLTGQTRRARHRASTAPTGTRRTALLRRAVVHFAVDTEAVSMTTRLAGSGDPVPAVQPGPRDGARGTRRTRTGIAPRTCGSRCGSGTPGSTCCSGSCTSREPEGLEGAGRS